MSLLIHNTDIHNLFHNGQRIKAAYFNGENVWREKHRVRWYGPVGNLLGTDWVTDGDAAVPPAVAVSPSGFHDYRVIGWTPGYDGITEDTDITAVTGIGAAYLFRTGLGINSGIIANGFEETCTAGDTTTGDDFTLVTKGDIAAERMTCSFKGARGAANDGYRAMEYRAALLDCAALTAAGYSSVCFSGTYTFGEGEISSNSIRSAFMALQTSTRVSAAHGEGVSGSLVWQKKFIVGTTQVMTVGAETGEINGSLPLPASGNYYLIVGGLSRAYSGTTTVQVENIRLE